MTQRLKISVASRVLNVVQLLAMGITLFALVLFHRQEYTELALASLLFATAIFLVDWAWYYLLHQKLPQQIEISNFRRALSRTHSLVAWLVFHSAIIPLLLLGPRSATLQPFQLVAFLLAVSVMGLIPVGLIVWMDSFLEKIKH